jgi:hypothetical protein
LTPEVVEIVVGAGFIASVLRIFFRSILSVLLALGLNLLMKSPFAVKCAVLDFGTVTSALAIRSLSILMSSSLKLLPS